MRLAPAKRRSRAGLTLANQPVSASGDPAALLNWLGDCHRSNLTITAPIEIESGRDAWHLGVVFWGLETSERRPELDDAAQADLSWLEENLDWLDRQAANSGPLLDLISLMFGGETVDLRRALLHKDTLRLSGTVCDAQSLAYFGKLLTEHAAQLAHPPRIAIDGLKVPAAAAAGPGDGIDMRGLDRPAALLAVAGLGGANLIAAGAAGSPLDGHLDGADAESLLDGLLDRMRLAHRRVGALTVAAAKLTGRPPAAGMFSDRAVDAFFQDAPPAEVLTLLADVSGVGLLPPLTDAKLALAARGQAARVLASLSLWAIGYRLNGDRRLAVAVPAATPPPKPVKDDKQQAVSLWAANAPLAEIVAELSGAGQLTDCSPAGAVVNVHLKKAPRDRLLAGLLLSSGLRMVSRGSTQRIEPLSGAGACRPADDCGAGKSQLYAIIKRPTGFNALLSDAGRCRWLGEGDRLSDGRQVRRIRAGRVVLKNAAGSHQTLVPESARTPNCGRPGCARKKTPTDFRLVRLRLAGTIRLGQRRAALIADPQGNTYMVREGGLLGRRCGSISKILPGSIEIKLACPAAADPPRARLSLRAVSRSGR